MVEHIHRIGATKPILELTFVDPDTDIPLPLGSITNPVYFVRFEGHKTNVIDNRTLVPVDANNGRFDVSFLTTDFTTPRTTGIATLWGAGDLPGSERFISEPIEIEIREAWQI